MKAKMNTAKSTPAARPAAQMPKNHLQNVRSRELWALPLLRAGFLEDLIVTVWKV